MRHKMAQDVGESWFEFVESPHTTGARLLFSASVLECSFVVFLSLAVTVQARAPLDARTTLE